MCENAKLESEMKILKKKQRVTDITINSMQQAVEKYVTVIGNFKKQNVLPDIDHIIETMELQRQARNSSVDVYLVYLAEKVERQVGKFRQFY